MYYKTKKHRPMLEGSKEKDELIKKLMQADKARLTMTKLKERIWEKKDWDLLDIRYLKEAWDIWGEKWYKLSQLSTLFFS